MSYYDPDEPAPPGTYVYAFGMPCIFIVLGVLFCLLWWLVK